MNAQNRPAHEIKVGRIRASIWTNRSNNGGDWFNVSLSRSYRDGDEWKDSASFRRDDLPLVSKVAELAYAWIWKNRESEVRHEQP